ncbi:hypothetical protein JJL56_25715 [Azospirillum sp. YIM DDC1]|uniref:Spy/CpxP family protein refolding chaperone n=1 Tax=Azospirillum aestuarii TaxID=2802052 RepID=A0ABS1I5S0_9PROT|nr:hypothetical protein [Azospirillum aestuarii]MBK4722254.1 hypothetical protein [Azospirillum aestuarii]
MRHRSAVLAAALLTLVSVPAGAAGGDPDWPCVQILVPTLSSGQIWPGDPIEGREGDWRDIPGTEAVLKQLLDRRLDPEQEQAAIDRFADQLEANGAAADRNMALTALFAGAFDALNQERRQAISAIKRYAHQQRVLLDSIDAALTRLQALPADASEATALREEIAWRRRILDERRRNQTALCEQPVQFEQKAGRIARDIAARLD